MRMNPHNNDRIRLDSKDDYLALFHGINDPLKKYYSSSSARIDYAVNGVGYGNRIAGIEGFARVLWGAGPAVDRLDPEWLNLIRTGICNGTDPAHPDYWGEIGDFDQRMVEMPAIALALYHRDCSLWKQLTEPEQYRVIQWLGQILRHRCADGNWQFFKVLTGKVIQKLGHEADQDAIDEAMQKIHACYIGGGWYRDSSRGRQDYYNPFAFHYYGLVYSVLEPEDPNSRIFRERAALHARDFLHFFAEDGANVPFGRSMIYRHAAAAFWAALLYAGVCPFEEGELKGLLNRNLRWWLQQDIFDPNGVLSVGYAYPQLLMSEPYNSSLSPYWSNKVFLILALDDDHDLWRTPEKAMSVRGEQHAVGKAGLCAVHDNGHTFFLNAGQPGANYHTLTNEKYLKFAYSSQFGFSVPRSGSLKEEAAMDSMLGVQFSDIRMIVSRQRKPVEETGPFFVRNRVEDVCVTESCAASTWKIGDRVELRTYLTSVKGWQIRIHRIRTSEEIVVYETGFAVGNPPENPGEVRTDGTGCCFEGGRGFTGICSLIDGITRNDCMVECNPNTNLMDWEKTCLPGLISTLGKGEHLLVTGVYAHRDTEYGRRQWKNCPAVEILPERVEIRCGNERKMVEL